MSAPNATLFEEFVELKLVVCVIHISYKHKGDTKAAKNYLLKIIIITNQKMLI